VLDLNEVSMFVEVVKAGSFAEASRRLRIPPSRMSRKIQQLEDRIGTQLLRRSTRKLALTDAGQSLYDRCASAVAELVDASQSLMEDKGPPNGLLRVAAPADFFDFFSMEWLPAFLTAYPAIRIEFVLSDAPVNLVEENIDVALRVLKASNAALHSRRVYDSTWHLVASPAYLARCGEPTDLQSLATLDCLPFIEQSRTSIWRFDGPKGSLEVPVTGRFGATVTGALLQAARAGLGIAYLPMAITNTDLRTGQLVEVLPGYRRDSGGFYAVFAARHRIPARISAFVDFVAEKFGDANPQSAGTAGRLRPSRTRRENQGAQSTRP
jgi:DNA-binding transcriptional LysR family regulator